MIPRTPSKQKTFYSALNPPVLPRKRIVNCPNSCSETLLHGNFRFRGSPRTDAEEREKCCRRKLARSCTFAHDRMIARCARFENLVRSLVVTRGAAGFAVHQAVRADADIDDRLAQAAILLALTLRFRLFTLRATILRGTGRSAHAVNASATGRSDET
jgi:hypothetical protein